MRRFKNSGVVRESAFKNYALHIRTSHNEGRGICGYWTKGAGGGMTVLNPEHATCKRCKQIHQRRQK